jgi:glycosyltransferase involved in cell wall biosynthesis
MAQQIGFDAKRAFGNFTGLGNYSRSLLHALAEHEPQFGLHLYAPKRKASTEVEALLALPNVSAHFAPTKALAAYWRSRGLVAGLRRQGIGLFHGLSHEIPLGLAKAGIRSVVTMHDLIFKRYPSHYPWADRQFYDLKCRYACRHADLVVAISESTRRDLAHYYGLPESKVRVVYQPCGTAFAEAWGPERLAAIRQRRSLPEAFFLYVGSLTERKNVALLVQALAGMPEAERLPLAIVGKGPERPRLEALAQSLGIGQQVFFWEDVGNDELPGLYQLATAFLYPSVYEGFGIPILEALQSGTPVLAANTSSLPEAGGPHSRYVPPHAPRAAAEALQALATQPEMRQEMAEQGRRYAQRFAPERIARDMAAVYRELLP